MIDDCTLLAVICMELNLWSLAVTRLRNHTLDRRSDRNCSDELVAQVFSSYHIMIL